MNLHQLIHAIFDAPEDVLADNSHDAILSLIGGAIGACLIDHTMPAVTDSDDAWRLSRQAAAITSNYLDNDPCEVTSLDLDRDADVIRVSVGDVLVGEVLALTRCLLNEQLPAAVDRLSVAGVDASTQPAKGVLGALACMRQAARQAEMSLVKLVEARAEAEVAA